MDQKALDEVVSSRPRLEIANLISVRPRTLKELARLTKMSVQGVLKHLAKLEELGMVSETRVNGGDLHVRKVYSVKGTRIGDYSERNLMVVKATEWSEPGAGSEDPIKELESLAADALIQRRRIREQARKIGRMIEQLVGTESRIGTLVRRLPTSDEDRLLLYAAFTEESMEEAEKSLIGNYGMREPKRALDKAIGKARKLGKK